MRVVGCEMRLWLRKWSFYRFEDFATISQLRNEGSGLRNGTRVPRGGLQLRNDFATKWRFRSDFLGLRNYFAAKCRFRRGLIWLRNYFAAKGHFRRGLLWLQNLAGHEFSLTFELLLAPRGLPSFSLQFLLH